jgi:capsular exopolysaccharide synthesis family protein
MPETPPATPWAGPTATAGMAAGLPLRELLAILRRRRRVIAWVVVLVTGLATLIGLQADKTYTATALVMVQPQEARIVDFEQVAQGLSPDAATIETQIKFIQSYDNLARTADLLNLTSDAALALPRAGLAGALAAAGGLLPDKWLIAAGLADAPEVAADPEEITRRAVTSLRAGLKVVQSGNSHVLAISYTAQDPGRAAHFANGIAEAYVQGQLGDKLVATQGAREWLTQRVEEMRQVLLASERAVAEYRAVHGLEAPGGSDLHAQEIVALSTEFIDAQAEQTAQEAKLRKIRELQQSGDAGDDVADLLPSPLIMTLREQELGLQREEAQLSREFGEQHPVIKQLHAEKDRLTSRIGLEVKAAVQNLENEIAVATNRAEAIKERLQHAQGEVALSGQAAVQLGELEREAAANRSLYENFLVRLKETDEQQELVRPDVRVISPAEAPDAPSSASPLMFAFVGFTASSVIGAMLALLIEQLDTSLRSTRQIEELLGVRALGLVPEVTGLKGSLPGYFLDRPESAYAQAVRALYAELRLLDAEQPARTLLVTSALPGEGKTSLAMSLAACAAELQLATLLLELDVRRSKIASELRLAPAAGIVEVLEGALGFEQVLQRHAPSGVDVLPAASGCANPSSLLGSPRLAALLEQLKARFDCVIIDTPPVLGVPDAKTFARIADATVFVVHWDRTRRDAVESALRELERFSARLAGAVLNHVDLKRHAQFSYGDAGQYYARYRAYYRD